MRVSVCDSDGSDRLRWIKSLFVSIVIVKSGDEFRVVFIETLTKAMKIKDLETLSNLKL